MDRVERAIVFLEFAAVRHRELWEDPDPQRDLLPGYSCADYLPEKTAASTDYFWFDYLILLKCVVAPMAKPISRPNRYFHSRGPNVVRLPRGVRLPPLFRPAVNGAPPVAANGTEKGPARRTS